MKIWSDSICERLCHWVQVYMQAMGLKLDWQTKVSAFFMLTSLLFLLWKNKKSEYSWTTLNLLSLPNFSSEVVLQSSSPRAYPNSQAFAGLYHPHVNEGSEPDMTSLRMALAPPSSWDCACPPTSPLLCRYMAVPHPTLWLPIPVPGTSFLHRTKWSVSVPQVRMCPSTPMHIFSLVSVPHLPRIKGTGLRFYVLWKWEQKQMFWQWVR